MKTIFAAMSITVLLVCSCTPKKSKAEEMNRKADSTYRADSIALTKQYQK